MKLKEFLRQVKSVLCWLGVGFCILRLAMGKADILCKITVFVAFTYLVLELAFFFIKRYSSYKLHKIYKKSYESLKVAHKYRYKLYFSGSKEEVQNLTSAINELGNSLILIGEDRINTEKMNTKMQEETQSIINQTKVLLTTIQPVV